MNRPDKTPLRKAAQRAITLSTLGLLWLSGALWLLFQWSPGDIFLQVQQQLDTFLLQSWLMRFHGLLAMFFLVMLGMLWRPHIRTAWKRKLNRLSGTLLFSSILLLCISGYGIYYAIGDWRHWNQYLHWALGLAIPLAVLCHLPSAGSR